jgi:hypothetical protein
MNSTRLENLEEPTAHRVLGFRPQSLFRGLSRSSEENSSEQRNSTMDPMKALAAEYKKKLREEEERKAEEERLKTLPLQEWGEFRQLMRAKMVSFNTHMQEVTLTWDSDESNQVVITRKNDERALTGAFDESATSMHFECAAAQIDFRCVIAVQMQAAAYLQADGEQKNGTLLTRDGITNNLFRDFLIN